MCVLTFTVHYKTWLKWDKTHHFERGPQQYPNMYHASIPIENDFRMYFQEFRPSIFCPCISLLLSMPLKAPLAEKQALNFTSVNLPAGFFLCGSMERGSVVTWLVWLFSSATDSQLPPFCLFGTLTSAPALFLDDTNKIWLTITRPAQMFAQEMYLCEYH